MEKWSGKGSEGANHRVHGVAALKKKKKKKVGWCLPRDEEWGKRKDGGQT